MKTPIDFNSPRPSLGYSPLCRGRPNALGKACVSVERHCLTLIDLTDANHCRIANASKRLAKLVADHMAPTEAGIATDTSKMDHCALTH